MEVNKNNSLMLSSNFHRLEDEELIEGLFAVDKEKPNKKDTLSFFIYPCIN